MTEGQVPPRVQWEGPHDRGAGYLSPQHYTVFHNELVGQPWLIVVSAEGLNHGTQRCRSQRTLAVQTSMEGSIPRPWGHLGPRPPASKARSGP